MGSLRRAAPIPVARPLPKPSRGAAPAACGAMAAARKSSAGRAGANQKLPVPCPKYTKVVRNGVVVEMEVIPVGGRGGEVPNARPIVKPPRVVETAASGTTMVRERKSARRAGGAEEQLLLPSPKRTKVTIDGVKTKSVDPALGTLRKRMVAELDALHALLRKAELLSSGNHGRSMAAAEQRSEAPPAKRVKVSTPAKIVELESAEDKDEFVDICGGVSPATIPVEKAGESGNSPSSSSDSGSSSSSDSDSESDSGSSSSSDSDSDSESDSDPDETVDVPVPQAVLPQEKETSVQPAPEPASKVQQSNKPAEQHSKADLIAKAKIRRQLLEMERAVLPDESIHARDLRSLCIAEYGRPSVMRQLGLFLKADA